MLRQEKKAYSLVTLYDYNANSKIVINKDLVYIGRESKCDIVINSSVISRKHAALICNNGHWFIKDCGSRNGTWVNGNKIKEKLVPLSKGDRISLAVEYNFYFEEIHEDEREKADASVTEKLVLTDTIFSSIKNAKMKNNILLDSICGCFIGGAYGDALGYTVEFMERKHILNEYGEKGIVDLRLSNGVAQISDDTQMTLFTANGILFAQTRAKMCGISEPLSAYFFKAYKEWYKTQIESDYYYKCGEFHSCWIHNIELLHRNRAPGNTCLSAIASGGGSIEHPANNSKGCGGVMRIAPVGCFAAAGHLSDEVATAKESAKIAALTHGHPLGYIPAAFLGCLIHKIILNKLSENNKKLDVLISEAMDICKNLYNEEPFFKDFERIINRAVSFSTSDQSDYDAIKQLGEGWVAEETVAIAIYSVLKHENDFKEAMICAVNHDGDSDSTGAVAGNILGAVLGLEDMRISTQCINSIEVYDVIYELSQDLTLGCQMSEYGTYKDVKWTSKYIECNYGCERGE